MDSRTILQQCIDADPFMKAMGVTGGTCLCRYADLLSERPRPPRPPRELPELSDEWKEILANVADLPPDDDSSVDDILSSSSEEES